MRRIQGEHPVFYHCDGGDLIFFMYNAREDVLCEDVQRKCEGGDFNDLCNEGDGSVEE